MKTKKNNKLSCLSLTELELAALDHDYDVEIWPGRLKIINKENGHHFVCNHKNEVITNMFSQEIIKLYLILKPVKKAVWLSNLVLAEIWSRVSFFYHRKFSKKHDKNCCNGSGCDCDHRKCVVNEIDSDDSCESCESDQETFQRQKCRQF